MASVLVRCFFSAAGISVSSFGSLSIPPLAPPIIGSIWVGAVGPCSAGCIPIGPVLSDGSRLLGMTSQRTTVIFVRLFRRRVEGEVSVGSVCRGAGHDHGSDGPGRRPASRLGVFTEYAARYRSGSPVVDDQRRGCRAELDDTAVSVPGITSRRLSPVCV